MKSLLEKLDSIEPPMQALKALAALYFATYTVPTSGKEIINDGKEKGMSRGAIISGLSVLGTLTNFAYNSMPLSIYHIANNANWQECIHNSLYLFGVSALTNIGSGIFEYHRSIGNESTQESINVNLD